MTPLETACGWVPGHVPPRRGGVTRRPRSSRSVRETLDAALAPALARPPCLVAFSGGRDSSVVLAAATSLARRRGLAPPVPVTRVHAGLPEVDEDRWQRLVLDHLGVEDWVRLELGEELDLVGPVARRVLGRHGPVWPAAAHTLLPLLDAASGGSLVTGEGGDELFTAPRLAGLRPLREGRRSRAAWAVAGAALGPRPVRRRLARRRLDPALPAWLTPRARDRLLELVVDDDLGSPVTLGATLRRLLTRRSWRAARQTFEALAVERDVVMHHPLLAPPVLAALHAETAPWGHRHRTAGLLAVFGDLLPDAVLRRETKAVFNRTLFGPGSRALANAWDGGGIDRSLVEPGALRDEWRRPSPSVLSAPLLQTVWCAGG